MNDVIMYNAELQDSIRKYQSLVANGGNTVNVLQDMEQQAKLVLSCIQYLQDDRS